jgi:hypothetical protein
MPSHNRSNVLLPALISGLCLALLALLSSANWLRAQSSDKSDSTFRNTDPSVAYVGSTSCAASGCHEKICRDYFSTPHGHSMAPANSPTELARAPKPITVFNAKNNHYYSVYRDGANLYQSVYELDESGRKIYSIAHKIDYVTGGERTGYTYMFKMGPWILQAPLSFYAYSKTWDLSPGYEASDRGFTRVVTTGCLLCHNGQPDPYPKRDGMFKEPSFRFGELGISCESCHGPGALHVKEMQRKKRSELGSHEVDTSIVNPAKLSPRLADDLCQECHQAGDALVLNPGKSDLDYRPGTPLAETTVIVMRPIKEEQREEANRLEVNPPVRGSLEQPLWWKNSSLKLSKCYQATDGGLTCSTCHSIHHAPKQVDERAAYRAACLSCHKETTCTLKPNDSKRVAAKDDCIECHMEKRPVAGIPHSNDTKHRIVRYPGQPLPEIAFEQPKPDLPGLLWTNRPAGDSGQRISDITQLNAYFWVAHKDPSLWPYWSSKLDKLSRTAPDDPTVLNFLGALAVAQTKDYASAADDFARALKLGSEEPTTFLNLAIVLENLDRAQEAEAVLERGVAAYPYSGLLTAKLAQEYAMDGQLSRARNLVQKYLTLFPEDSAMREVQEHLDAAGSADDPATPSQATPVPPPN